MKTKTTKSTIQTFFLKTFNQITCNIKITYKIDQKYIDLI
jgi:hypothetical protein